MSVRVESDVHGVVTIALARPDVRNAFDAGMVAALHDAVLGVPADARAVLLRAEGTAFCAGADLDWMRAMADASTEDDRADARALAELFAALDALEMPLLARVQGPAIGGGAGLVAVADIAIAASDAHFAFREVRVGIVPAVISPYVVRKTGPAFATAAFVTGERFGAERAYDAGLVHAVVPADALDAALAEVLAGVLGSGPRAARAAKRLVREVCGRDPAEVRERTVELIATIRASAEGREGMRAFLERRPARW